MSKKFEVSVWVATATLATNITRDQTSELEKSLGGTIAVEKKNNEDLVIYSSNPKVKDRLAALITILQLFTLQKIHVQNVGRGK